jgi:PPM family protein phosphatase
MSSTKRCLQFSAFGRMDVGLHRTRLEDALYISEEQGLFIVSDGVGGAAAGDLASTITVKTLPLKLQEECKKLHYSDADESIIKAKALGRMVDAVKMLLLEKTMQQPATKGLGATVVAGYYVGHAAMALTYLGDSRAYLLRHSALECLTQDHTVANVLYQTGKINKTELVNHPARHVLTRYVGMRDCPAAEVMLLPLKENDRILFCTDGLTSMVSEEKIGIILAENASRENAAHELIACANAAGGHDNVTVIVVDVLPHECTEKAEGDTVVQEDLSCSALEKTRETLQPSRETE